ncbi:Galectin-3 [Triplophysa tibetana]|uniref:Galectin n=1 Tax=Triplophysa tibetana TaxID=1572043 RepID=A0A5A9NPS9_9TELE|nr:Galectin-3 [Triplophysa tibetana]
MHPLRVNIKTGQVDEGEIMNPPNPAWPGQPPNPALAFQPAIPVWPGQPNQPAQPTWPGQPGQPGAPGWPGPAPYVAPEPPRPLTVPYELPLVNGAHNKMLVTINGDVQPNAKLITIDIKKGNDIALHLNPRFDECGKQVFVRNSCIGNRWGQEERQITSFPFVKGKPFELKILCTSTEFKVAVNKSHLLEYKHRIRDLNQINTLRIYNDVTLRSVNVETLA